jgi:hypothetical protein
MIPASKLISDAVQDYTKQLLTCVHKIKKKTVSEKLSIYNYLTTTKRRVISQKSEDLINNAEEA